MLLVSTPSRRIKEQLQIKNHIQCQWLALNLNRRALWQRQWEALTLGGVNIEADSSQPGQPDHSKAMQPSAQQTVYYVLTCWSEFIILMLIPADQSVM